MCRGTKIVDTLEIKSLKLALSEVSFAGTLSERNKEEPYK